MMADDWHHGITASISGVDQDGRPNASEILAFVIHEMARFQRELNENGMRNIDIFDALSLLRDERGRQRIIGRQAAVQINRLAEYEISQHEKLKGRVDTSQLADELKRSLIDELQNLKGLSPDDIVNVSVDRLISSMPPLLRFYCPCVMPRHSKISKFMVGPVAFHRKESLQSKMQMLARTDELLQSYIHQNEAYNWIAEITLSEFSYERGRRRADLFARLAIAGVKLCFKERFAKNLGTIEQLMPLTIKYDAHQENDKIYIGYERNFTLNATDDDIREIFSIEHNSWLRQIGSFLDQYINRNDFGFIGGRLISALTWTDTGSSSLSSAHRIVAYSNALETLFVTGDGAIGKQIRRRAHPLLSIYDGDRNWQQLIAEFYKVRSDLVHGALSPVSETLEEYVVMGADLATKAAIAMLNFCSWLLQRYPPGSTPREMSPFSGPGSLSKAFDDHLAEFVTEHSAG